MGRPPKGPASIRERGDGFQVRVYLGPDQERYAGGLSEREAKQIASLINERWRLGARGEELVALLADPRPAPLTPSGFPKLRDALPPYIDAGEQRGDWSGSTPRNYRRALRQHVYDFRLRRGHLLGDLPVDQVKAHDLADVLDYVRSEKPKGLHLSSAVLHQIRSPIARYYEELILDPQNSFRGPNPAADLKRHMRAKPSTEEIETYSRDEAAKLFKACREHYPQWLSFIGCGFLAGLRYGEIAGLDIDDPKLGRDVIFVNKSFNSETGKIKVTKNRKTRYVPVDAIDGDALREAIEGQRERVKLEGQVHDWTPAQRRRLHPNRAGNYERNGTFWEHVWQPLHARAGVEPRSVHAMRHSFGTWCAEGDPDNGIEPTPLHTLKVWMGHSSIKVTERYLHARQGRAGKGARSFGGRL